MLCLLAALAAGEDPGRRAQAMVFVQRLGDADLGVVAERSLIAMGEDAVPALGFAVRDLNSPVRAKAAQLLGSIGGDGAKAELARAVGERDAAVRVAACRALVHLGDRSDRVVAGLAAGLSATDEGVRGTAAEGLREAGKEGRAAIPALMLALEDPSDAVREQARLALTQMGVVTVDALRDGANSDSAIVRTAAVQALGGIDPDAKAAVSGLVERLADDRDAVRVEAARALGAIGADARDAAAALRLVLEDEAASPALRIAAFHALESIGARDWDPVRALGELRRADDPRVRAFVADAYGARKVEAAVPVLMSGVNDMSHLVREASLRALGRIAPADEHVRAIFLAALDNRLLVSRAAAARTLKGMGDDAAFASDKLQEVRNQALEEENDALVEALR
jgi:HEAT repeat protein